MTSAGPCTSSISNASIKWAQISRALHFKWRLFACAFHPANWTIQRWGFYTISETCTLQVGVHIVLWEKITEKRWRRWIWCFWVPNVLLKLWLFVVIFKGCRICFSFCLACCLEAHMPCSGLSWLGTGSFLGADVHLPFCFYANSWVYRQSSLLHFVVSLVICVHIDLMESWANMFY